jgi:hypothetical protein
MTTEIILRTIEISKGQQTRPVEENLQHGIRTSNPNAAEEIEPGRRPLEFQEWFDEA